MREHFLWGNSVSSMQTEGAWNEDAKGMSVYDIKEATPDSSDWKVAIDEYHRYGEDFDLMKEMGVNCYRFQISWCRIIPEGTGEINQKGFEYYDRFIDSLIERGITPMICLYHFDMPLALAKKYDGFLGREVVDAFVSYAKLVIDRYQEKVKYWIVFNEQNLFHDPTAYLYAGCLKTELCERELVTIYHHAMTAYAQVANYLHKTTNCQVGGMIAYVEIYPETCHPADIYYARKADEFLNQNPLEVFATGRYSTEVQRYLNNQGHAGIFREEDMAVIACSRSDFLAFSYYNSTVVSHRNIPPSATPFHYVQLGETKNPFTASTKWNWNIDAMGFRNILAKMYNRFHLPLFPVENGIGAEEIWDGITSVQDTYRIDYHRDHIQAMKDAVNLDGVDVIGYLCWGLIDIPSSQGDMRKRYGAVYVNRENHDLKDLKRVKKESFYWFQKMFKN